MSDLHEELTALSVDWPETPDLAGAVARAAGRRRARPPGRAAAPASPGGRRSPTALAAIAAAFALTMAASPDARSAVLEWLGLKSVKIERREPSAPAPQPGTLGSGLGLGTPVTLAQARRGAPFLRLPEADGLGRPDAVYLGPRQRLARLRRAGGLRARAATTGAAAARAGVPGPRRRVHREVARRGRAASSG